MSIKRVILLLVGVLLVGVPAAFAQDTITDDEVNAVAKKLYCPVCENIPLDTCGNAACDDWRYEIRLQLEQGMSEEAIVDDFIARFGERVVGTPKDPVLRAVSLITPWLLAVLMVGVVGWTFVQWGKQGKAAAEAAQVDNPAGAAPDDDDYRAWLERDLKGDAS